MLLDQYGTPIVFTDSRQDAWQNGLTGIGTFADKTTHGRFFPTFRLQDRELVDLFNGSSIAAKAVSKRPQEMFRRGYELESPKQSKAGALATTDQIQALTDYARDTLDLDAQVLEALIWGRLFGGSLLILGADDGGMPWEPLDETRIRSFDFLNLVDRRYAYVQSTYARRGQPKYGKAQIYLLSNAVAYSGWDTYDEVQKIDPRQLRGIGANIALIHESRVVRFEGAPTDVVTRQQLAGWTYSVLQRVYGAMRSFEHAFDSASYLLSDFAQGILKLKGLAKAITAGQQQALSARMAAMEITRSVLRSVALDADAGEEFSRTTTPITGVSDVLDRMMLRLCAEMDIPANELFGQGGGGLNAAGEAEAATRKWYDGIATDQTTYLGPVLRRIYRLIGLAKRGPIGGKDLRLNVYFEPLWSPTDKEVSATRASDAQRRASDIAAGIVTPEEVAPTVVDLYPDIDLEAREAARAGAKSFDPYGNDEPEPAPVPPTPPGGSSPSPEGPPDTGEPDSPASPNTSIEAAPKGAPGDDPANDEDAEKRGDGSDDQPRDEAGRWSANEAAAATSKANAIAEGAKTRPEHLAAAGAHRTASAAHKNLAEQYRARAAEARTPEARTLRDQKADDHESDALLHEISADYHAKIARELAPTSEYSSTSTLESGREKSRQAEAASIHARAANTPEAHHAAEIAHREAKRDFTSAANRAPRGSMAPGEDYHRSVMHDLRAKEHRASALALTKAGPIAEHAKAAAAGARIGGDREKAALERLGARTS